MDGETRKHLRAEILRFCGDSAAANLTTVMCVGHNKGWEEAASQLCGQKARPRLMRAASVFVPPGCQPTLRRRAHSAPSCQVELDTGSAAVLEARGELGWEEALREGHVWSLRAVLTP